MQKLELRLGELCEYFLSLRSQMDLPFGEVWDVPPKISKGEAYGGLPWLMLDYPRYFKPEGHFAIRIFCWWGNFIGIYWHTSNEMAQKVAELHQDWDGWENGFVNDPYEFQQNPNNMADNGKQQRVTYYRIAKRYPLTDLDSSMEELQKDYAVLLAVISQMRG